MFKPGSRLRLIVSLVSVLVVALSACGQNTPEQPAGKTSAPAGAFPVTIEHQFGSTTIEEAPKRVLAIGFNEQDFVLAFGVEPVGVREFLDYDAPNRPWAPESVKGRALPTVGAAELKMEKVAELQPDLILGINSYIDKSTYGLLSKIAPTVAQSADFADGATPWAEQTQQTGRALGQESRADELVEQTQALFDQAKADHPAFAGKKAAFAFGSSDSGTWRLGSDDYRGGWLTDLGFTLADTSGEVSFETLSTLDRDVLIAEGVRAKDIERPVFQQLAAVKEGRFVNLGAFDDDFAAALGFNSPLSIPFLLDVAVPRLDAATDDDPATKVAAYPEGAG